MLISLTIPSSSTHTSNQKSHTAQNKSSMGGGSEGGYDGAGTQASRYFGSVEWTLRRDGIRFRPTTCPETSGQNTKKKNVLSISKENHPRENTKKQETFFLFGVAE
jgi:hypothetical protein